MAPDGDGPRLEATLDVENDQYEYAVYYDGREYESGSVDLEYTDEQGIQQRVADAVGTQLTAYAYEVAEQEGPEDDAAAHTEPVPE